ncbi:hypothetical protein IFM89_013448 [Coptis chinensis]|uniref:Uncharacterized protein n=1 Tax=Coptis chinensis TaxID=261450 RepID=A0A835LII7_9MAGN|nr:hypothetical protein IFM89_013448 [Coptis chinensis]
MEDSSEPQSSEQVCNFFRKPTKNKNIRKRTTDEDDEEEEQEDSVTINRNKKQPKPDNKLVFSTGPIKKSDPNNEENESKVENSIFQFESSSEIQVQNDSRATAISEIETDYTRDARAIRERMLKQAENTLKGKGGDEKVYKGIHGYTDYKAGFRREQTIASEKAGGSHGPLRASAHIRASTRFDYQPDICKDYKETGYCGFGDACKFMHDRGDYKSGWQMEREWDEAEKVRKRNLAMGIMEDEDEEGGAGGGSDDDDDEKLPFACFICREAFVDPVVTKCKHYFCEHCALKNAGIGSGSKGELVRGTSIWISPIRSGSCRPHSPSSSVSYPSSLSYNPQRSTQTNPVIAWLKRNKTPPIDVAGKAPQLPFSLHGIKGVSHPTLQPPAHRQSPIDAPIGAHHLRVVTHLWWQKIQSEGYKEFDPLNRQSSSSSVVHAHTTIPIIHYTTFQQALLLSLLTGSSVWWNSFSTEYARLFKDAAEGRVRTFGFPHFNGVFHDQLQHSFEKEKFQTEKKHEFAIIKNEAHVAMGKDTEPLPPTVKTLALATMVGAILIDVLLNETAIPDVNHILEKFRDI